MDGTILCCSTLDGTGVWEHSTCSSAGMFLATKAEKTCIGKFKTLGRKENIICVCFLLQCGCNYNLHRITGNMKPIQGDSGNKTGNTLDRVPTHCKAQLYTHSHTTGNVEMPISLHQMSLD